MDALTITILEYRYYIEVLAISIAVFIYLGVAMFKPEWF